MALMIDERCTACDACEPVCPNKAITAARPMYVIVPQRAGSVYGQPI